MSGDIPDLVRLPAALGRDHGIEGPCCRACRARRPSDRSSAALTSISSVPTSPSQRRHGARRLHDAQLRGRPEGGGAWRHGPASPGSRTPRATSCRSCTGR